MEPGISHHLGIYQTPYSIIVERYNVAIVMSSMISPAPELSQESAVQQYFDSFNRGCFQETAALFAEDGQLRPPFEEPIVGRSAIRDYLTREASSMKATPQEISTELTADKRTVTVKGAVTAAVFQVNAAWIFVLDPQGTIASVRVKLLASLQDLVSLRPSP